MRIAKRNLKKQSQFAPVQADVKSYPKGDYGNKPTFGAKKTKPIKPNQSQFGCFTAENAECAEVFDV